MGIRETINENRNISIGVIAGVIVIALIIIIWEASGGTAHRSGSTGPLKGFYSDDDGKTYFTDAADKISPFTDSNGRQAVQAFVFRCGSGKPFVVYLQRYTDAGRDQMQKLMKQGMTPEMMREGIMTLVEVKKPGARDWVKYDSQHPAAYNEVVQGKCPDGTTNNLEFVVPGME